MASKLDIYNLALIFLRKKIIQDPDASSLEARTMNRLYPVAYDFLLREHPWSFCNKVVALSLSDEVSPLYTYVYQYPIDCVKAGQLVSPDNIHKDQDYEIASSSGSKVILTDVGKAVLRYTARIPDTNDFDSIFVLALAARLAADGAINLTGRPDMWEANERKYMELLNKAKVADAKECKKTVESTSEIADSRF